MLLGRQIRSRVGRTHDTVLRLADRRMFRTDASVETVAATQAQRINSGYGVRCVLIQVETACKFDRIGRNESTDGRIVVTVAVVVQPAFAIELLPLKPRRTSLLLLLPFHPPIEKGFVARIFEVFVDVREVPFDPRSYLEGVKESIDPIKAVGRWDRQRQVSAIDAV